jgi:hypothetical protein
VLNGFGLIGEGELAELLISSHHFSQTEKRHSPADGSSNLRIPRCALRGRSMHFCSIVGKMTFPLDATFPRAVTEKIAGRLRSAPLRVYRSSSRDERRDSAA